MSSICGIDCNKCNFKKNCLGCEETCGKPFGGDCIAEKIIKASGKSGYISFKINLLNEINEILVNFGLPMAQALYELNGEFVNLEYTLFNGEKIKFLDDKKIYLGSQIEDKNEKKCYGVVCDENFILVSSYLENGENPQLLIYKKR